MEKMLLNAWSQAVINGDHIVEGSVALWCDGGAHFELEDDEFKRSQENIIVAHTHTLNTNVLL